MKTIVLLVIAMLGGCATDRTTFQAGKQMIEAGRVEDGLREVNTALQANPQNIEYRTYYVRQRDTYISQLVSAGDKQRHLGKPEDAEALYTRVLALDAGNTRAQAGLAAVQMELRHRQIATEAKTLFEAGDLDAAQARLRPVLAENPQQRDARALMRSIDEQRNKSAGPSVVLKSSLRKPVTLEFRDALLKNVFEVLSRTSGINFLFDKDVRPDLKTTIFIRDTRIEDAIRFLLTTNQLEMRVLNDTTILVYPNLPNKQKDYQELTVKSFYITNADVKQTLNLIKTVIKTRDIFVDERLNMLTMRDTPEAIRMAEKLIAAQDLVDPEVILEVEVLEIDRDKLINIGIDFPTQLSFGAVGAAGAGQFTLAEWLNRNAGMVNIKITDPALVLNLQHQDIDTNILANPRIRVRNREKARILIGSKVPVITTTSTANVGISESVTYLDVGLKLNVEPTVYLSDEVAIKVGLEVSSITNTIKDQNGTTTYTLGTRNAETVLRLRSGETEVLAGLIQDQEQITANKVPGLGDLPVIGRLFGSKLNQRNKTEIVLLITPYIVRNIDRPDAATLEFLSGTDSTISSNPMTFRPAEPPQVSGTPVVVPVVRPAAIPPPTSPPTLPQLPPATPEERR